MPLLGAVLQTNEAQPEVVVQLLKKHWPALDGLRIAVLGLAFKPGTNDVRESPAFSIMRGLLREGATLKAHDPVANADASAVFAEPGLRYCDSLDETIADVDAAVVVTPWPQFRDLPARVAGRPLLVVDARRAFARDDFARYEGIGL